ncbi:MAG: hypothetical protein HZA93_20675 [Verrucomicrobia bacterium]|nr:hypothetical protein [Verrucomicrobiota bacterium]
MFSPTRRVPLPTALLPAALLLLGVVASWSLACAGHRTVADGAEDFRQKILADLRKVLPAPASRQTAGADRLRVTLEPRGEAFTYYVANVVAVGDFTTATARDFALVARQRYQAGFRIGTIHLYSDAGGKRRLIAAYGLDHASAIKQAITPRLPPPEPGFPNRVDVAFAADGLVDRYTITVVAPFAQPDADALAAFVRQFRPTLAGDLRFVVKFTSNAGGPWVTMAQFDTAQEK